MLNKIDLFQKKIWDFYQLNKRNFAWREQITPYKVFVSEVMLQQTQTSRVVYKFEQWLQRFPDFVSLAQSSSHQVLSVWQGLGYNRRGLALHRSAQQIVQDFAGQLPDDPSWLQTLPGIGPNTASSICAFAFNRPVLFVETNIRTVFLHEFFQGQLQVSDKQLLPLIEAALDQQRPRDWYYALMDYGVYLKKEIKANNKNSKHYNRQSQFQGSRRQVRGAIVRLLSQAGALTVEQLSELVSLQLPQNRHETMLVLDQLIREKIVHDSNGLCKL